MGLPSLSLKAGPHISRSGNEESVLEPVAGTRYPATGVGARDKEVLNEMVDGCLERLPPWAPMSALLLLWLALWMCPGNAPDGTVRDALDCRDARDVREPREFIAVLAAMGKIGKRAVDAFEETAEWGGWCRPEFEPVLEPDPNVEKAEPPPDAMSGKSELVGELSLVADGAPLRMMPELRTIFRGGRAAVRSRREKPDEDLLEEVVEERTARAEDAGALVVGSGVAVVGSIEEVEVTADVMQEELDSGPAGLACCPPLPVACSSSSLNGSNTNAFLSSASASIPPMAANYVR